MRYFPAIGGGGFSGSTTDDLPEGVTNFYYTNERVDDRVAALLVAGSGITLTYNDGANTLTVTNQLRTGLAGGQTIIGGAASGEDLTLQSTSHATRGSVFMGPAGTGFEYNENFNQFGFGESGSAVSAKVVIKGAPSTPGLIIREEDNLDTSPFIVENFMSTTYDPSTFPTGNVVHVGNFSCDNDAIFVGQTQFVRPIAAAFVYTNGLNAYGAGIGDNTVALELDTSTTGDEFVKFHAADTDVVEIRGTGINLLTQHELRFQDTTGGQYAGFKAAGTTTTGTYTLPAAIPSNNKFLQSDSSGVMTWVSSTKVLFDHFADAGNTTTSETDLYSDTTAASTLAVNGDKIWATYGLNLVNSTSTKQVRVKFAGTTIFDSGALTISASGSISIDVKIIRVSASVIRYSVMANSSGASTGSYASVGELTGLTLSNTNILKITGQAAGVGAATNDIVAKLSTVQFQAAA